MKVNLVQDGLCVYEDYKSRNDAALEVGGTITIVKGSAVQLYVIEKIETDVKQKPPLRLVHVTTLPPSQT